MEVHIVERSSDSRKMVSCTHTHENAAVVTGSDELPASTYADTTLHELENSFQVARDGDGDKDSQGNVNRRKQDPNILTSCVQSGMGCLQVFN